MSPPAISAWSTESVASAFWENPVTVAVPATSANLGPGFDCLGLALDLVDEVTVQVVGGGLAVEVEGEGAPDLSRDESHLVVSSMRQAFDAMEVSPAGLLVHCRNRIPHARGLGSSSAAIVAGLWAARACVVDGDERMSDADLLDLATRIEGHPDNVAPCLLGGLTLSWTAGGATRAVSRPVRDLRAVAVVPGEAVSTGMVRGLLPEAVPLGDAVFNAARTALLLDLLAGDGDDGRSIVPPSDRAALLLEATDDRWHQRQRSSAMPRSFALVEHLRSIGLAAFISGAGPTVLVLVTDDAAASTVARAVATHLPDAAVTELAFDDRGARVLAG
jgi:homoserine kinase